MPKTKDKPFIIKDKEKFIREMLYWDFDYTMNRIEEQILETEEKIKQKINL